MADEKYGMLYNKNALLHRKYFNEMVKLIGIQCIYYQPRPDKHWTTYAEIKSNYFEPIVVGCIYNEHLDQRTMKKLGWVSELDTNMSAITVSYDLPGIQVGALFVLPSGLDDGKGRLFRVASMQYSAVYPATVTCQIVPEYEDTFSNTAYDHTNNSFNLLDDEDEHQFINSHAADSL